MLIGDFIGWFLRLKAKKYLTFKYSSDIPVPDPPSENIELYIHIPFCTQLCPYCSFHRVLFHEPTARLYFNALRKEITLYKELGYKFGGVYIGGGTPTILMDELIETIDLVQRLFSPDDVSVETNPDRLQKEAFLDLVKAGVKRISVGIQSFDDSLLKQIGRFHKYGSGEELKRRVLDVMGIVQTLNLDMIYNFPTQTQSMLDRDLDIISEIKPDQTTFYPLMISDATRRNMESIMGKIDYRKESLFYSIINARLSDTYTPSSAWCFSRSDTHMIDEYITNYSQYIGTGSGSFGLIANGIYSNTFSIKEYIELLDSGRFALKGMKLFSQKEMERYLFLMNLFGMELDRKDFIKRFGYDICYPLWLDCLFFMLTGGIYLQGDKIKLTTRGQYYWVVMMREFFIGVDNFRDMGRNRVSATHHE